MNFWEERIQKDGVVKENNILIIDDFLANGRALQGLISEVSQSLAIVDSMGAATGQITFRKQD